MILLAAALGPVIGLACPAPASAAFAWSDPVLVTPDGLTGVACSTAAQCTAVGGAGQEFTFNPSIPGAGSAATIDRTGGVMQAVACPTATQCTAVDEQGYQTTFNPQSPSSTTQVRVAPMVGLMGIACPTTSQCTAVGSQYEVTFDPASSSTPPLVAIDPNSFVGPVGGMDWVTCPSASECIAVDYVGQEVAFDPSSPGTPAPTTVDPGDDDSFWYPPGNTPPNALEGVSCPAATQCTAVDPAGGQITFNPASAASPAPTRSTLLPNSPLSAISCPTSTSCAAVGHNGRWAFALEGDPRSGAPWFVDPLPGAHDPTAVACPTAAVCIAVDYSGHEITGTYVTGPPAPVSDELPDLTDPAADVPGGTIEPGQALTATPGTWFNSPSTFAYQWDDCDVTGTICTPIPGATGPTYTLGSTDVGHMIRLDETAANAGGSDRASSIPWALVHAADDSNPGDGGTGSDSGATDGPTGPVGTAPGAAGSGATLAVGQIHVQGAVADVGVRCAGRPGASCAVQLTLTIPPPGTRSRHVGGAGAHGRGMRTAVAVSVGRVTAVIPAGRSRVLRVALNTFARKLLHSRARLRARLKVATGSTTATLRPNTSRMLAFTRRRRASFHRVSPGA